MSENVNPLLFSASSSIFDNLSSSAVLLPPQNDVATVAAPNPTTGSANAQTDVASSARFMPIATTAPNLATNFNPPLSNQSTIYPTASNGLLNTSGVSSVPSPAVQSNPLPPSAMPVPPSNIPLSSGPSLTTLPQTVTPNITPRITPNNTPSTTPVPTPSVTPRLPPSVTPIPPSTFAPLPPPNFSSFPLMVPGGVPPPPQNFVPPSFGRAPPPPPPSIAPSFGKAPAPPPPSISPSFRPVNPPHFSSPSSVTTTYPSPNTTSQNKGLASASTHPSNNWTPPIYGESPVQEMPIVPPSFENMATSGAAERYRPVLPHWFYAVPAKPVLWKPFSFTDSINLEEAHRQGGCGLVSTDGGRYDVEVSGRVRRPVYWESTQGNAVRRCSWYRKGVHELTPQPYEEEVSTKLEDAYRECMESGSWQRQVEVTGDSPGLVVLASPFSMHHYHTSINNAFPTSISIAESQAPDTVKRGANDFEMSDGEAEQVDHLLFLVHGIGPVCDLSFRSVEECVDTFRELGGDLVSTHFHQSVDNGLVGRVEVLPISWHKALHSDSDGIDQRLKPITLRSIPMLREFTNDTIVDVLLYTSPAYCQLIIDTVSGEFNRLYRLFKKRNPLFTGGVSMAGHSLGSVILFDLLMHQKPILPNTVIDKDTVASSSDKEGEKKATFDLGGEGEEGVEEGPGIEALQQCGVGSVLTASAIRARRSQADMQESLTSSVNFEMGTAGTGQPSIAYPQLLFQPQSVFMLGSPIAMFLAVRGLTQLSPHYRLPTCPNVFNIFHPFDPVAYRLETLIHPHLTDLRPVLVPHHKGRKRMHLELKDTLERMGSDIKTRIVGSIQSIGNKLYTLYAGEQQQQVEQALEEELGRLRLEADQGVGEEGGAAVEAAAVGQLNGGRRIDYVLQEKPYESLTEYIFALQAHLSYWKSEDTLLLMLKEIYGSMGITCDAKATNRTSSPSSNYTSAASSPLLVNSPTAASFTPVPLISAGAAQTNNVAIPNIMPVYSMAGAPAVPPIPTAAASGVGSVKLVGLRPVVDPSAIPQSMGMDPTAEPLQSGAAIPPPPTGTKINFSRKKGPRR